jgi:hypothetical protein
MGFGAFLGIAYSLLTGLAKAKTVMMRSQRTQELVPWISSIQLSIAGYLTASLFLHGAYIRYFWMVTALAITVIQLVYEIQVGKDKDEIL